MDNIRSIRLFNIAVIDLLATILFAYLISKYKIIDLNFQYTLIILLISGIILHRIFKINSTINVMIFGKIN